jgi:hypothetical protein
MPRYNVLITCHEYIEITGKDAKEAEWHAYQEYKNGYLEIEPHFEFVCEEADLVEESEDA